MQKRKLLVAEYMSLSPFQHVGIEANRETFELLYSLNIPGMGIIIKSLVVTLIIHDILYFDQPSVLILSHITVSSPNISYVYTC